MGDDYMATGKNRLKVCDPKDIQRYRAKVIEKANCAYEELNNLGNDRMSALFKLRYEQIGFSPLKEHRLTIAEQMNQTYHALAVFAAAEIIFKQPPICGTLSLSPLTAGGRDIESDGTNLVAAEVFTTVKLNYNRKLWCEAAKMNVAETRESVPFCKRFVFFYTPSYDPDLVRSVRNAYPKVDIRPLSWNELMEGGGTR